MKRNLFFLKSLALVLMSSIPTVMNAKDFKIKSPDGKTEALITVDKTISYSVIQDDVEVMKPSNISLTLADGTIWGVGSEIKKTSIANVDHVIQTPLYKDNSIKENYNEISILFKEDWEIKFRAYNDGIAYRFVSHKNGKYEIKDEQADFNFQPEDIATVPYVYSPGSIEHQLFQSFENTYSVLPVKDIDKNRLMFLPLSIQTESGKRVTVLESDLRDYPGMYLKAELGNGDLEGYFARVRDDIEEHAGYNNLQVIVKSRHDYIAKVEGERAFPWRAVVVTSNDAELANTNMTYLLAEDSKIKDLSWIKPGKVSWDWWNDLTLEGVDFKAGINNETYKFYIDFASKHGIEYVILDEGWAVNKVYDLMQIVPEIDIKELVDYGKKRNVGIILWAGYYAFDKDMEKVCKHYSKMGVKGFKIDFMNGDDQDLVKFNERAAQMTAKYHLLLDLHGTYKPSGLNRTYPHILNFEGVFGLEQMKWSPDSVDHVTYSVTMPYLRMISGPVDYTQGAMNNAVYSINTITNTKEFQYYPNFSKPMSQGTRMHQLAEYIVFFSPLNMLCDSPTNYMKNPVSTAFIASVPTVWDETRTIQGKMGEYIITARRSGDKWYIGGVNNWTARDVKINVKEVLGINGKFTLYKDGPNSYKNGTDFIKETIKIDNEVKIHMAPGGGFVLEQIK